MDGRVLGAGVLSLILAACGGGGGGGGSAAPPGPTVTGGGSVPSSGPGDTLAYFPLATGKQWLYNSNDSSTNTPLVIFDVTVAVNGTKTVQGQLATIFTRSNSSTTAAPTDQYYASSGGGITYLGTTDPADTITPLLIPYPQLLFPVVPGTVSSITGKNLAFGKDTAGKAITLSLTQTIVNSALETVSVPAGTFTNAMKQVTTVNGTAVDGSQSIPVSGTDTVWLAPGVGQVKETSVANASGTSITNTFDLKGFVVNGQSHGFGPPKVLTAPSTNLADVDSAVASDGTNFLLVTHHNDMAGTLTLNWVGTLLARDGTIIKTFDITAPVNPMAVTAAAAVAAYDGSNYLVVYVPDLNPGGQPDTLEAIRISPAGTILGPAITVVPGIAAASSCAIAFDGTHYLLVYLPYSFPNSPQLVGELLSPSTGQPLGPSFPIAPPGGSEASPALAFDGTNYLVAWEELQSAASLGLDAARVSTAGVVLDASPIRLLDTTSLPTNFVPSAYPAVSFDGTNYLVAYQDVRTGGVTISASRVSSSGKLLDGSSTQPGIVVTSDPTLGAQRVSTASLGGQYWLIWQQSSSSGFSVFGARVSAGGLLVSPGTNGFVLSGTYPNGTQLIGADAGSGVIVWQTQGAPQSNEAGISFRTIFP